MWKGDNSVLNSINNHFLVTGFSLQKDLTNLAFVVLADVYYMVCHFFELFGCFVTIKSVGYCGLDCQNNKADFVKPLGFLACCAWSKFVGI